MRRVLVTGAGRGLGLEIVRQCLARGDRVFAGCRNPQCASDLHSLVVEFLDRFRILPLDVSDPRSIDASWNMVREQIDGLDLLINNAGINSKSRDVIAHQEVNASADRCALDHVDFNGMFLMLRINAISPLMVAQRYLDLLQNGVRPTIINISSERGSLALKKEGGYAYSASKAALNMLTRALALDVTRLGIMAVAIDPGWIKTDMGGPHAPMAPAESAQGILRVVNDLTEADIGRFLRWDGTALPW